MFFLIPSRGRSRSSMIGGRVCLYFFWPAGCALICNCTAVFTREVRRSENNRSARFPIGSRELLCFAFSTGDGWTIERRGAREKHREVEREREEGATFIEGQKQGERRESGRTERSLLFRGLKLICMGPTAKRLSCRAWFRFDTPTNCSARVPPRAGRRVIFAKAPASPDPRAARFVQKGILEKKKKTLTRNGKAQREAREKLRH